MKLLLCVSFILVSCDAPPTRGISSSYYGTDVADHLNNCTPQTTELICRQELQETQDFKSRCLSQQKTLIQCACDQYLCVDEDIRGLQNKVPNTEVVDDEDKTQKVEDDRNDRPLIGDVLRDWPSQHIGIDFYGNTKTCSSLPPDIGCLAVFTKFNEYAFECRRDGYDVVYCDCDDPICLRR